MSPEPMTTPKQSQKKPYSEQSDAEKVISNWRKTRGLFKRGEFSVAILRAATTAELMTNLAIRHELVQSKSLPMAFVDHLLVWANGISGKFHNLLLPVLEGAANYQSTKELSAAMKKVNEERNRVAHRGEFKKRSTAHDALVAAHKYISGLAATYAPTIQLLPPETSHSQLQATRANARN